MRKTREILRLKELKRSHREISSTSCACCTSPAFHYWIANPEQRTLVVHRWEPKGYLIALVASPAETVRTAPFDAVDLSMAVLFDDAGDDEQGYGGLTAVISSSRLVRGSLRPSSSWPWAGTTEQRGGAGGWHWRR